ncbi:hypothetical protein P9386_04990 [Caldifermentibacillus hisashii]|uniref:hypothetical protein n=1 Tax=Caldifermentibacillus hisashii TaxID=996558 RepID=UPI002E1C9A39|nr:hypothetical protein [Caldifermentibacillus hisashii]
MYAENLIDKNAVYHYRQFKETIDGDRLPIFPDNKAVIFVGLNGRYRVQSLDGEVVFIGTGGIDEALGRIDYAQPYTDVEIHEGDRTYTRKDYYRHIAPVVYLIAQHFDDDTGRLAIAYERRKNGRLLDDGTVIFADDGAFADWLASKVKAEERPPAVRFDYKILAPAVDTVKLNNDCAVEVNYSTWLNLRRKAKKAVM